MLGSAGTPGVVKIVIHDYLKQGDSVTLVFSEALKALESIAVSSYLDNPKDGMTLSAQFTKEPQGREPCIEYAGQRREQAAHGRHAELQLPDDVSRSETGLLTGPGPGIRQLVTRKSEQEQGAW